jgi:hypothetical protein
MNDISNAPYLILLRVESTPRGLWRSLQGPVYLLTTTRIEGPTTRTEERPPGATRSGPQTQPKGDSSCPVR